MISNETITRLGQTEIQTNEQFVKTKFGYLVEHPSEALANLGRHVRYLLDPVSFSAGSFTNNPILFRISPNYSPWIDFVFLILKCSETGGVNTVTPVAAPYLIDRIEIGVNGDPTPVQTITADALYSQWQFFSGEQMDCLTAFNQLNMTTASYAGETAIAAGGSATYIIPLPLSVLKGLNPQTLRGDIMFTVYPRSNPVSAGNGTLELTSIQLKLTCHLDPIVDSNIKSVFARYQVRKNYMNVQSFTTTTTLTAGVTTEIPLSGIDALVGSMCVLIRSSKAVASSAIRTFSALGGTSEHNGTINILDQTKTSILGSGAMSAAVIRGDHQADRTPGNQTSKVALYWIHFCQNPVGMIQKGINSGFVHMNGNYFLQLTPGSGFTNGSYIVDVLYLTYSQLMQYPDGSLRRLQ